MQKSLEDLESLYVEGNAPFVVGNNTYQTYYRIAGDLKTSSRTPVVILHGGPGLDCQYLHVHADLTVNYDTPVVLFDQLGGGKSTHLPHKGEDFWTPDLFCDQLEQLLDFLNISENYHLVGHSWGGMLAAYFAANRKHHGLKRIVLVSTGASLPLCDASVTLLIAKFPEKIQESIKKQQRGEEYDEDDIKEVDELFQKRHICQLDPIPECFLKVLVDQQKDRTVHTSMNGDSPFKTLGTMEHFSVIEDLHKIDAQTLLINGEDDICQDICVRPYFEHIRKIKWVHYLKCAHMPFFEVRDRYMQLLGDFLNDVD